MIHVHLHKVAAGTSRGQLEEVQPDAAAPEGRHGEREEEAGRGQVVGLDALAHGARVHIFSDGVGHAGPPHQASSEREGFVPPELPSQRRGV